MTLRPSRARSSASHEGALDYEIAHEQAVALGRLGRALERALAALSAYERARCGSDIDPATTPAAFDAPERARLVQDAADALWRFIIQREACGLRDPRPVIRDYGVPAEVQNRMGVFGGRVPRKSSPR